MATVVLGALGSIAGGAIGGAVSGGSSTGVAIGKTIGSSLGSLLGNAIDDRIFSQDVTLGARSGYRLADLAVQSSSYGEMIPIIYGTTRIAGNMIWSQQIKETANTTTSSTGGGKGGGSGKVSQSTTTFSYSVTLAIAICEGPIDEIVRVWADAKVINPNEGTYRLYKGTETQTPDTLIESIEGVGKVPAYRGIAYVVIEDFPLADYGNRIPNFTFEVRKSALVVVSDDESVEELIKDMVVIPGAGEFVYDDTVQTKIPGQLVGASWVQQGNKVRINQNNRDGKADALVSLDQLENTCPNLEWVAVVVTWFGDSIDAGDCLIKPGVEYQSGAVTSPDTWAVGSYTRSTARQITLVDGSPQYGGTPSDVSLLRYIQEIKSRGYNVMFLPMFFMDTEDKPWRGRVTGSVSDVANFFTKTYGYNDFINHYANLVKDDVDAFIIGSELIGLTSVQDSGDDSFPAVDALISLASTVKSTVGSGVKVSYAADWSEYHHDANGWYNLDPLWASSDIDFVGIDAYFPLTDQSEPVGGFDQETLRAGWTSGEGYDWYYSDEARTVQTALSPEYAWKNIAWWWNNTHDNPDMATTAWTAQMKPIWFTEFGFPSLDGASNRPNVFVDPNSSESAYPYHSKKRVDFRAQRNAIKATLEEWRDSSMVEHMFLWTWDARPFPFYPDLSEVWADGDLWRTGHWVTGKLGNSTLAAIVSDLSERAGLDESQIDVSRLTSLVDGFVINGQTTARSAIDSLRTAFFFDAVESDGLVKYVARAGANAITVAENSLIPSGGRDLRNSLDVVRIQELELPQKIDVVYINKAADYQTGNQHSQRQTANSVGVATVGLPVVMDNQTAKNIADITLYNSWLGRTGYNFSLPLQYAKLEPTDVITVTVGAALHVIRITNTQFGAPGMIKVAGVAEDVTTYDFYTSPGDIPPSTEVVSKPGATIASYLDLPAFPTDNGELGNLRYAATGTENGWHGAVIFRSDDDGANYSSVVNLPAASVIGTAIDALADGVTHIFDEENSVTVNITGSGELSGASEIAVLNGANLAKIGAEIIQFKTASLVSSGQYILSGLLRGRLGTENAVSGHSAGEEFVLIDNNVVKEIMPNSLIGLERLYKAVSVGDSLANVSADSFTYQANALKPFSPVHITASRDISDNLTLGWIRRTRVNGQWQDNVDVPIGEVSESYEIDIMDGSNIVRTITSSSATASYSAAEQTTDFGSPQGSITVNIYQISAVVGRGTAGAAVV